MTSPDTANRALSPLLDIILLFGAGTLVMVLGLQVVGDGLVASQLVVWSANIVMILAAWYSLRRRGQRAEKFGVIRPDLSARGIGKLLGKSVLTLVGALAAFVLGSIIYGAIAGVPASSDTSSYEFLSGNLPMLLLVLAGVFVASSFGEEWIYRGFLVTRLEEAIGDSKWKTPLAVAGSSLIFGLAHFGWGPVGVVQTTFMGAALALFWLRYDRNLWVVVIAHAIADAILMIQMYAQ